jgi:adenylate cyclase
MLWAALAVIAALVAWTLHERRARLQIERRVGASARALETLQGAFARFAPADVVEDIIARGVSTRSEKKDVTVLFADLKGFTAMSERLDPAVIVTMLNAYFERMSRIVTAHRGHVAKFIGDGMMAHFGAVESNPWQTNDAVQTALAMREALVELNRGFAADGLPPLAVSVGIHRGPVVAGVLGSAELVEYGVIGSTVNVASRVEELTRVHDVDILVTDAVQRALDPRIALRAMPPVAVKGLPEPLPTWAVDGVGRERSD